MIQVNDRSNYDKTTQSVCWQAADIQLTDLEIFRVGDWYSVVGGLQVS